MQPNQDLNSNLIKSLTSVHLPPPPSSHNQPVMSHFTPQPVAFVPENYNHLAPQQLNEQYSNSQQSHQQIPQQSYVTNDVFTNKIPLQQELRVSLDGYQQNQYSHVQQPLATKPSQSPTSSAENQLPLNTPPHTITRHYSIPKNSHQAQETPTLNQSRVKKNNKHNGENPLSPQYSSPSSSTQDSAPKKVIKPPQPSFVTPKVSRSKKSRSKDQISAPQARALQEPEFEEVPSPSQLPTIIYDSDSKPPYSYATLIGMAILRGEDRKLTLSQIYYWISTTFRYYRKNDVGWQNSIRHNLSLNKAFIKTDKSSDGKGHYWEIVKGYEMQFLKGKTGKRTMFGGVQLEQTTVSAVKPKPKEVIPVSKPPASDSSEDEFSDTEEQNSKTPRRQIRSIGNDNDNDNDNDNNNDIPSLKKSNTVTGLEKFELPKISYSDHDETGLADDYNSPKLPRKKQQLRSVSTSNVGALNNIPSLEAPDTTWAASASGEHIIFGQIKPSSIHLSNGSPTRATRVSSLTSFSCNTNFDISPLKREETGPLLEPLTPSSRLSSFNSATTAATSLPSSHPSNLYGHSSQNLPLAKTPLRNTSSNSQNINSGLVGSTQSNHVLNFLRTPNARNTRTPNSNSIMKKFWNSPSFIEDFYTSPSVPRFSDDDHHKRLFGSPDKKPVLPNPQPYRHPLHSQTSEKKTGFLENSGNDLFGVDIFSVVQRAVESCREDNRRKSLQETIKESASTDDEQDSNVTI